LGNLVSDVLGNVPVKRWSERIQGIYIFGGVALTVVAVVFVVASFWGLFREALAIDVLWCAQSLLFLRFEFPSWRDERESFLGLFFVRYVVLQWYPLAFLTFSLRLTC